MREIQMYSRDELSVIAETYELDASMTPLRNNFKSLASFFGGQTSPAAVAGQFTRLSKLYPWFGLSAERRGQINAQGLDWPQGSQDMLLLAGDFDNVELANLTPTGGPSAQIFRPAQVPYLVTGPNSGTQWRDKPLRGSLP